MKKRNKQEKDLSPADPKTKAKGQNLRRLLILAVNTVLFYALLRALSVLSERMRQPVIFYVSTIVYALATAALFLWYFVKNGFTFNKESRTEEELPARWTQEQKTAFLARQETNKADAKKILYVLLPLVITLLVHYIELNFF